MEINYLTSLFWQAIRAINGFPVDGDQLFLERAVVTPSLSLQQKVFLSADYWLKRVEDDGDICPDAICAQGFLRLINNLRVSPQLVSDPDRQPFLLQPIDDVTLEFVTGAIP